MPAGVTRICQRLQSVSAAQRRRPLAAAITTIETAHSAPTRTPYKNVKCSANWMWEAKLEGEGAAMWDACEGMCDMMRRRRHAAAAASQGVRCCGGGDGGDASARAPATQRCRPLSTRLHEFGFEGLHTLGQNSGQNVRGGQVCSPEGRVVRPSFSAPPLSLPKLSFPVNWGWERIHLPITNLLTTNGRVCWYMRGT